jgi:hypothetical protein
MITDINNEDRLVQATFADHLRDVLGWESVFAHNEETFGPAGTLGRASEREAVKAHTLMQAIARANRIYSGKDCGVIVDYNGMLKSLRAALAYYALGDAGGEDGGADPAIPLEEYVPALVEAIEAVEKHLRDLGFEPDRPAAQPASPALPPCAMPWTRSTRRMNRSAGPRSWPGSFSRG